MRVAAQKFNRVDLEDPRGSRSADLRRWRHRIAISLCRRRGAILRAVVREPAPDDTLAGTVDTTTTTSTAIMLEFEDEEAALMSVDEPEGGIDA